MMDIVEKLRQRPFRYAAEAEFEAQERRQKEREDGAEEIAHLRKKIARLQEMLEPFAKAYNDTIAAASIAPRFVKKGHEIFFEEEPFRAGCGFTEMYDVSNENTSLAIKNVVLSQEITRLRKENARLRAIPVIAAIRKIGEDSEPET